ncbi:MAG: trypsin-like peptidase domain-containing protein [Deltaproteobacteria bacterium]|nr:trypsin-like peptidase domain-containing protein [Deltaproteobacteria bacterium]
MVLTSNVLTRLFKVKHGDQLGTSFVLDVGNAQYLVTARHVLRGYRGELAILLNGAWRTLAATPIWAKPAKADIAAIRLPSPIAPNLPLPATCKGFAYGQDAFFLGYPLGMQMDDMGMNAANPLPFAKKGCISAFQTNRLGVFEIFLDGHSNPGFSGGPLVTVLPNDTQYSVIGVVSGRMTERVEVVQKVNGKAGGVSTDLETPSNSGILVAHGVDHILTELR